jgi:hypothetical protein
MGFNIIHVEYLSFPLVSWRLLIVGIFLGGTLIGATYLEEFLWIFLLIGLAIVAIFLLIKYHSNTKGGKEQS